MRKECPYKPKDVLEGKLQSGKKYQQESNAIDNNVFLSCQKDMFTFLKFFLMLYFKK